MNTADDRLVTGVDFSVVPAEDFERAASFYGDVLGLERSIRWGDMPAQEFETGNLTLAVMQSDAFGLEFQPNKGPIALQVGDVKAARERLEREGVAFKGEIIDSGVCHQAIFTDPDGNALNLHHRYAPGPPTEDVEPPSLS